MGCRPLQVGGGEGAQGPVRFWKLGEGWGMGWRAAALATKGREWGWAAKKEEGRQATAQGCAYVSWGAALVDQRCTWTPCPAPKPLTSRRRRGAACASLVVRVAWALAGDYWLEAPLHGGVARFGAGTCSGHERRAVRHAHKMPWARAVLRACTKSMRAAGGAQDWVQQACSWCWPPTPGVRGRARSRQPRIHTWQALWQVGCWCKAVLSCPVQGCS